MAKQVDIMHILADINIYKVNIKLELGLHNYNMPQDDQLPER